MWYGRLEEIIEELRALPYPWVDRAALERSMRVGRRRAQQILQPCVTHRVGANGVADRNRLIAHLHALAESDPGYYEIKRRQQFLEKLDEWKRDWAANPRLPVEAPESIVNQRLENLPDGVQLGPGFILLRFNQSQEALEKLLALAMAIGNDLDRFDRMTSAGSSQG